MRRFLILGAILLGVSVLATTGLYISGWLSPTSAQVDSQTVVLTAPCPLGSEPQWVPIGDTVTRSCSTVPTPPPPTPSPTPSPTPPPTTTTTLPPTPPPPTPTPPPPTGAINGYAGVALTTGGAGGTLCTVTGSTTEAQFRACVLGGNKLVQVIADNDITLTSPLRLGGEASNLTIEALPGVSFTLRTATPLQRGFHLVQGFQNGIFRNFRMIGGFSGPGGLTNNDSALFELDGDPNTPAKIRRVALVNMTFSNDPDGAPQLWCGIQDVTIEGVLVMDSFHPFGMGCRTVVTDPNSVLARTQITVFRSVFARNGERQPQLREGVYKIDVNSTIITEWRNLGTTEGGNGMILRDGAINDFNLVNNAFLPGAWRPGYGCILGGAPGVAGQAALETELRTVREIYAAGNLFFTAPGSDCNQGFKRTTPNPRPYTLPTIALQQVLATVGAQPRTSAEQSLLDEISARLP